MNDSALIEARELSKSFGESPAVDQISLQIAEGEIYGLVGPDGAGKTTTLRLLCGALTPDSGQAIIAGFRVGVETEKAREQLGYLPQRFSLYEDLTVFENIQFFAEVRGISRQEWRSRSMEILTFVGLAPFTSRRAGQLSGGMKQKLGLAAALVHRPRVLLLDEPTTGVDPVTRQDFWQLIIRLVAEERVAVLISTPYMDEATRCRRVGFMRVGRMLREGTPDELRASMQGRIIELRGQPLPKLRRVAEALDLVETVHMFGDRIHLGVRAGNEAKVISELQRIIPESGGEASRLRLVQPQLEDVFMSLLADRGAVERRM
jgi:ABC-2 type transport system ATP-binding protein